MTRPLKFRAWDKEDGTEYRPLGLSGTNDHYHSEIISLSCRFPERFDWEQSTGLTDKDGKEIYEGDIVRILYTDWPSLPVGDSRSLDQYLSDISSLAEIVFVSSCFRVHLGPDKHGFRTFGSLNMGGHGRIEVIGNVHEHPHLLEEKE